jgi:molybdopterin-synthase adenylyltransferase
MSVKCTPELERLRALPVQLIEVDGGVVLKRGCLEIKIGGEGATRAVQLVLAATAHKGVTREEIYELFPPPRRPAVRHLLEQLVSRRILVPSDGMDPAIESRESSLEVFYWHFGEPAAQVSARLDDRQIVIFGVNGISRQLDASLSASGLRNFRVVDEPRLRNLRLFDDAGQLLAEGWPLFSKPPLALEEWVKETDLQSLDCLVATSDFGDQQSMREWNKFCVEHHCQFLPVVLQNLIGYVGPLVIPGETACFECLRLRQNAHLEAHQTQRAVEDVAFEGQAVIGFHPSMASILGDIAAFELTKFYSGVLPQWHVGTLIEVNLLAPRLAARKVLKIPRCMVCSPLNTRSSNTAQKTAFTPARQVTE